MARSTLAFYQDADGSVPLLEWLDELPAKAQDKCLERLERLEERGHELRRPHADFLRDGVYELRIRYGTVQYRMLYFFLGRSVVMVSHGLQKERRVPPGEIERALERKTLVEHDATRHTFHPQRGQ